MPSRSTATELSRCRTSTATGVPRRFAWAVTGLPARFVSTVAGAPWRFASRARAVRHILALGLLFPGLGLLAPRVGFAAELDAALQGIRPEAIRAHMSFLADDMLEGRGTGSPGYLLAAKYVAAQFEQLGLSPAGEDDGYLQWMQLRETRQVGDQCHLALVGPDGERKLKYAEDFLMRGDAVREHTEGEADLVYVGFGVRAPQLGYDDYEGVDVEGKIVVMLRGAPPTFPHNERAYFASGAKKRNTAVAQGAIGMVTFLIPEDAAKRPWKKIVVNSTIASMRTLGAHGEPLDVSPEILITARLSQAGAEAFFTGAASSLEDVFAAASAGKPHPFDLPHRARYARTSRHGTLRSCNVAGLLEGSDPVLRRETVVFTAHLDHLGVGEAVDGDAIYNGAFDNASGTSVMIEVARAFASLPQAPRRSVLFLAVTGEEKGLLGSKFFIENPTVSLDDIVANVNLDMFLMLHPLRDIIAFGEEHSTLTQPVARAAKHLGFEVTPDPMPSEVIFVRSDQYEFVKKGIPAIFLVAGFKGHEPGKVSGETWMRDIYHTQKDDMDQYIDLQSGVTFARANLMIGWEIANAEKRPHWNAGDFFGDLFGRDTAARAGRR